MLLTTHSIIIPSFSIYGVLNYNGYQECKARNIHQVIVFLLMYSDGALHNCGVYILNDTNPHIVYMIEQFGFSRYDGHEQMVPERNIGIVENCKRSLVTNYKHNYL